MSQDFVKMKLADRKHMENWFKYAVTASVTILTKLLSELNGNGPEPQKPQDNNKSKNVMAEGMTKFAKDTMKFISG
jgi:hypothetical protein